MDSAEIQDECTKKSHFKKKSFLKMRMIKSNKRCETARDGAGAVIVELDLPETLLESTQQAAQGAGITWSAFVRQALEHEATRLQQERCLIDEAMVAYERTRHKYANALQELAK